MYQRYAKRGIDIVVSFVALVLTSPLLIFVALALRRANHGPVLFYQTRPGLHAKPFQIIKFRTMTDERGPDGALLPDPQRITPLGRIIRAFSIDELLQLINVLRGEMSLIGPRPLLPEYLPFYTEREKHRHDVRPGISGLAQVNGRNALNWDRRLRYDTFYVKHVTLALDAMILARTLTQVLRAAGIDPDAESGFIDFDDYVKHGRPRTRGATTVAQPLSASAAS